MKVKAIKLGFFDGCKKRPGDVFEIADEKQFSKFWMKKVDESLPVGKNVDPEPEVEAPKKGLFNKSKKEKKAPQSEDDGVI